MTEIEELQKELKKTKEELEDARREIEQLKAATQQNRDFIATQRKRWVGVMKITVSTF